MKPIIINVNSHKIKHNAAHPDDLQPPIRVEQGKNVEYVFRATTTGPATIEYSEDPLKCGARVWLTTHCSVLIGDPPVPFGDLT